MVIPELKHGPRTLRASLWPARRPPPRRRRGGVRLRREGDRRRVDRVRLPAHRPALSRPQPVDGGRAPRAGRRALVDRPRRPGGRAATSCRRRSGRRRSPAGLVLERTGGLHPARFHAGLARVADTAGAELHAAHPARWRSTAAHGATTVVTSRGRDRGRGGAARHQRVRRRTGAAPASGASCPMGSFIIATEPVDAATARDVSPRGRMMFDSKNLLWYWRFDPEGRHGVRRSPPARPRAAWPRPGTTSTAAMVHVHPQLAGVRVERAWGGKVALTVDRLPHVGRSTACGTPPDATARASPSTRGSGTNWPAPSAASRPLRSPSCAHPVVPLHRARALYLPVVSAWMRWKDARR